MQFFPGSSRAHTTTWMQEMDAVEVYGEKDWQQLRKNEQILEATSRKRGAVRPHTSHL